MRLSEPTFWTRKDHYIEISGLIEEDNNNPIYFAQIELDHGGIIRYDSEILIVMFPENESLKEITIEMLKSNGYFAAELLWEFCENRPEEFSLDYILALEEKDITDEFERMLLWNEELKSLWIKDANTLIEKLKKATKSTGIKRIAIGGGVSANSGIRQALLDGEQKFGWTTYIPKFEYTTDNAAMIGIVGYLKYLEKDFSNEKILSKKSPKIVVMVTLLSLKYLFHFVLNQPLFLSLICLVFQKYQVV